MDPMANLETEVFPQVSSGYVEIAIEHGSFTVDLPIEDGDFP